LYIKLLKEINLVIDWFLLKCLFYKILYIFLYQLYYYL
jgi:hypothetical protein